VAVYRKNLSDLFFFIGIVFFGGPAPGGQNVIAGQTDAGQILVLDNKGDRSGKTASAMIRFFITPHYKKHLSS
jgi:hypothetical protein